MFQKEEIMIWIIMATVLTLSSMFGVTAGEEVYFVDGKQATVYYFPSYYEQACGKETTVVDYTIIDGEWIETGRY